MPTDVNCAAWKGFTTGEWRHLVNVRNFIQKNYTPYEGDDSFLEGTTEKTDKLWQECHDLIVEEIEKGIIDVETSAVSGIDNFAPGYIDKENEVIVGLQTDKPLKRIVNLYGGFRTAKAALASYGYTLNPEIEKHFGLYRKTHNDGVFDAYPKGTRLARTAGLLTGLPDAYGRGRIVGDYRRVPLYGTDFLIEEKEKDLLKNDGDMTEERIRLREEISMQIRALKEMASMAAKYGCDITKPAATAREAVQNLYMAYLAGIKENNGAATSLGRTATFLDIYIQRDIDNGTLTEKEAQELIDQFIMKLRLVRHLRTPDYNELFGGDPTWITESLGGMGIDGRTLVTKNTFRYLHTLTNLGTAPEPNMTVLWSNNLPIEFKKYCAKMSIESDAIQYESDDLMMPMYGDDYCISCCVSAMAVGKQMQFFGARANLAKSLLYAINGGVDEKKFIKVVPEIELDTDEVLDYSKVLANYKKVLSYVAKLYVDTINIIHYMHDKYAYEASQMALHDTLVSRIAAFGVAGLSIATDSLSAIKFGGVKPIRNEDGIAIDFEVLGDFPKYGNDNDIVDDIAVEIVSYFSSELKKHAMYRGAVHTLSALTITSNVMYGEKTGTTPDGRKAGEPFAPGANPMHGRDENGALASLNSVAKIPYRDICQDGVSNTFTIVPDALGKTEDERINNLVNILNGYFRKGAHHLNVNVLNRAMLIDAMDHPELYPTLTIRVSGYAVNFNRLTRKQQLEVIKRTFHESM